MSYLATLGALVPPVKGNPTWFSYRNPGRIKEGEELTFVVWCAGYKVGAMIQVWFTPDGPGNMSGAGNWLEPWPTVIARACEANGCIFKNNDGPESPPTLKGSFYATITVGPDYRGQDIVCTNTSRRNRSTDVAMDNFGGPGYRQMQCLLNRMYPPVASGKVAQFPDATPESFGVIGSWPYFRGYPITEADGTTGSVPPGYVQVMDTSKTPSGVPALTLTSFAADGVSPAPVTLSEGQSFMAKITVTNLVPGTKLRVYVANVGQNRLAPSFRDLAVTAGKGRAGLTTYRVDYPLKPGDAWFNGVFYTFDDGFDESKPIELLFTARENSTEDGVTQLDLIVNVEVEGDSTEFAKVTSRGDWDSTTIYQNGDWVNYIPDGVKYIYTATSGSSGTPPTNESKWRFYNRLGYGKSLSRQVKEKPARYWEIVSNRVDYGNGMSVINYTLNSPRNFPGSSVRVEPDNVPADFLSGMQQAIAKNPLFSYDAATGRVTSTADGLGQATSVTWQCLIPTAAPTTTPVKYVVYLKDPSDYPIVTIPCTCTFTGPVIVPPCPDNVYGVNLSGGEFSGTYTNTFGTDYRYPEFLELGLDHPFCFAEMDYYHRRGCSIFRLPFRWQRLQEGAFGPLRGTTWPGEPGVYPRGSAMDMLRVDALVNRATQLKRIIMLDMHDFLGGPKGSTGNVAYDNPEATAEMLADFWIRIVNRYAGNPYVWIDLMNEPHGAGSGPDRLYELWTTVIALIRAKTNFLGRIVVEGTEYTSAANWVTNGQADAFLLLKDPANNLIFSPHCYLDGDASGTKSNCVTNANLRLVSASDHARANGYRLLIGEINGTADSSCPPIIRKALQYIHDNKDTYVGFTAWGAGKRWGANYLYNLDPSTTTLPAGYPGYMNYDDSVSIEDKRLGVVKPYFIG